jgi:dynein heavy chain
VKIETSNPKPKFMEDEYFLKLDQSKLPLHLFDNEQYETKTPDEWLAHGECKAVSPFYMDVDIGWQWRPCTVIGYEPSPPLESNAWMKGIHAMKVFGTKPQTKGKFLVRFDGAARTKLVQRINLQFADESEEAFRNRRTYAHSEMERTKTVLRHDHYVEMQSSESMQTMQASTLAGINERVMDGLRPQVITELCAEKIRRPKWEDGDPPLMLTLLMRSLSSTVIKTYTWCMKKQVLMHRLVTEPDELEHYTELRLPPLVFPPPAPKYGKLVIQQTDIPYEEARARIFERHYTNPKEVRQLVLWFENLWFTNFLENTFMDTSMEASALVLPCKLDDFKALQRKHCEELTNKLHAEWRQAVAEYSTDYLQDIWDFYVPEWEMYDGNPLCRLLKVTELRMRGQMRHIAESSVHNWLEFIQLYCGGEELEPVINGGRGSISPEELTRETFLQRKKREREALPGIFPLFQAELVIKAGGVVELEPSGQAIKSVFQESITQMVDSIKKVSGLQV